MFSFFRRSMAQTLSSLDFGYNEFPEIPFNTLKILKILNWLNLQKYVLLFTKINYVIYPTLVKKYLYLF